MKLNEAKLLDNMFMRIDDKALTKKSINFILILTHFSYDKE